MPEAKPISANSTGTAIGASGAKPIVSASTAAMPKPTPTIFSQRDGSAARKPPITMPPALATM